MNLKKRIMTSIITKSKLLDNNIKDLINGYCKQNYQLSIPHSIILLISLFFNFIDKCYPFLFKIQFREDGSKQNYDSDDEDYCAENYYLWLLTSITSYFIVSNKCYKLILTIGNEFKMIIGIKNNLILINNNNNKQIHDGNGQLFKITKNFVEVMIKINKDEKIDGISIELFFRQLENIPDIYSTSIFICDDEAKEISNYINTNKQHRLHGQIKKEMSDGYYKIELNDFVYRQSLSYGVDKLYWYGVEVSVESYSYGVDKLNVCSCRHAHYPCNLFGFGDIKE